MPRSEGKHVIGGSGRRIAIPIPVGPEATNVTLTAEVNGQTAVTDFSIVLDPKEVSRRAERQAAEQQLAKEGREELIKLYSTDVDNCKKKIAELEEELAKKAKEVKTFDDASFLAFTQHNLVAKRFEGCGFENAVNTPKRATRPALPAARADTGTRLALRLRMYDLDKAKAALEHKERLANWEVDDMLYRRADVPAAARQDYDRRGLSVQPRTLEKTPTLDRRTNSSCAKCWRSPALRETSASWRDLATRCLNFTLKLLEADQNDDAKRLIATRFTSCTSCMRTNLAEMTGNRAEAAVLWVKGFNLTNADSGKKWDDVVDLPAWWPEGTWQPKP